jgi:hypothetical protein
LGYEKMTHTNIFAQRLLNVARATREALPQDFKMDRFAHSCGTPACAFGHYCARTDLQSAFKLMNLKTLAGDRYEWYPVDRESEQPVGLLSLLMLIHFDISESQAMELFSTDGCGNARTPEAAASYFERFVAFRWP